MVSRIRFHHRRALEPSHSPSPPKLLMFVLFCRVISVRIIYTHTPIKQRILDFVNAVYEKIDSTLERVQYNYKSIWSESTSHISSGLFPETCESPAFIPISLFR